MNSKDYKEFIRWELAARDHIDLKRCYVDVSSGDLAAGVLLSQIIYWFLPSKETGANKTTVEFDAQRWLVKARHEWWAECRLTPKQFDRAIDLLQNASLVVTSIAIWKGKPTLHIALLWDNFIKRLRYVVDHPLEKPGTRKGQYFPRKSMLTKGEEGRSPKVKKHVDQRSTSLTKSTSKTTTKITTLPKRQKSAIPKPRLILNDPVETNHQRLLRELFELTGPIPDGGAQGKAAKWLLEKYDVEKASACLKDLVAKLKDRKNWREHRVSLLTVQKEIGSWLIAGTTADQWASVGEHVEDSNAPDTPEEEVDPRFLELARRNRTPEETEELAELIRQRQSQTTTTTTKRRVKNA